MRDFEEKAKIAVRLRACQAAALSSTDKEPETNG
jgi:hypothetical protein